MFLFHCCHVSFHHPLLLHSKARLSKIIPAVQIPRNLVYDRDPSAVSQRLCPQMSLALCCSVRRSIFSPWTCSEALKVTFFCSFPGNNCQQLLYCCANSSQNCRKTLSIEGKITLAVAQCWCCASTCSVLSPACCLPLTCSPLLCCHIINLLIGRIAQPQEWCENFKSHFFSFAFCNTEPYLKWEVESFGMPWKNASYYKWIN